MKLSTGPQVVVFKGRSGLWYWHRRAKNNRITSQGQGYTRRYDAIKGAARALGITRDEVKIIPSPKGSPK